MLAILDAAQTEQLRRTRNVLSDVRSRLISFGAPADDQTTLDASIRQLEEVFLLVVVGEFNAGKSAFINALIGRAVLREGVTPTTDRIHVLQFGETVSAHTTPEGIEVITAPADFLRDVHVVDTPGTNAILREHERLTTAFMPRSDVVLFVTAADRPFTETERAFLSAIRAWGKKVAIVVNRIDVIATDSEIAEIVRFVAEGIRDMLGFDAAVLPVSARLALRAKEGEPALWSRSRFEAVESYLRNTLDAQNRLRLKLSNPLGVGAALVRKYAAVTSDRLALLADDMELLRDVEHQLSIYNEDLRRGFELRMSAVEHVLADMEARGHRYFENTLRIGRVVDLLNRARIQKEFEDEVVSDAPRDVERRVGELIDWLVDQDLRQWQAVTARVVERHHAHSARALGASEVGSFHIDRTRLLESFGRQAQRVVDEYDRRREAETIADQARTAVAAAAAAGGAAVGVGTLVTIAASTVAADVTGILLASVILGVGFLIIPARRRRANVTLAEKVTALRERLTSALRIEFDRAQERSAARMADAIAPYSRFVRAEERRWTDAQQALAGLDRQIASMLDEP
ncbi:MAG TPA: dynamin family protein [Vicinamibacterales bacterium]|nr:dynamin family protein [Vicinamibacterales bacterium]